MLKARDSELIFQSFSSCNIVAQYWSKRKYASDTPLVEHDLEGSSFRNKTGRNVEPLLFDTTDFHDKTDCFEERRFHCSDITKMV